ncbi:MAG: Cytochrome c bioproteinis factor [bacterium]|nr:MAG: Cytochrome c bioproteinis factor [bacterium]
MKINKLVISLIISLLWLGISVDLSLAQPAIGRPDPPKPVATNPPTNPTPPRKVSKTRRTPRNSNVPTSAVPRGKSLDFYVTKGTEVLDNGDFELAAEYFQEADKKRKDRTATPELLDLLDKQIQVAKLHIESDDTEDTQKALNNYLEILKLRPNDPKSREQLPDLYNKIADDALNQKDYDRAVESLDTLIGLNPTTKEAKEKLLPALLGRGEAALSKGKDDIAQNSFRRVLDLDPQNQLAQQKLRVLDLKGLLEFAENKLKAEAYEDAMVKFKEALSIDPENEQAQRGAKTAEGNYQKLKAEQLYANRKYSDSEKIYQVALVILPDDEKIKARLEEIAIRLKPASAMRGKSVWSGKINNPTKLKITGKEIKYEGSGDGSINERLPEIGYLVKKVKALLGGVPIKIVEQPSASNKYTTTISIEAKKPKNVSFEIEWELKRQGKVSWQGQINGRSLIRVQGSFVDIEQVSGIPAKDVSYESDPLPAQEATIKVNKLSGSPEVRLIEAPSSSNSYIAILEIESSSSDLEPLVFQLEWLLK